MVGLISALPLQIPALSPRQTTLCRMCIEDFKTLLPMVQKPEQLVLPDFATGV